MKTLGRLVSLTILFCLLTGNLLSALDLGWSTKTSMPAARLGFATVVFNSKIYTFGGFDSDFLTVATTQVYDPATDTWETKADMPTARAFLGAAAINNKIYVIGGRDIGYNALATVEEYDPAANTWTTKTDMLTAREDLLVAGVNNKIYCIGGSDTSGRVDIVEEYTPATDSWAAKTSMPGARNYTSGTVVSNIIYVIGGYDSSSDYCQTVEAYDPLADTWSTKADILTARGGCGVGAVNNSIFIIGGNWDLPINSIEEYAITTDTWTAKLGFPYNISDQGVAVVNGNFYVMGGNTEGDVVESRVEEGILTNPPTLHWTGETNYSSDGLDPEIGYSTSTFVFRVEYTDADNDPPLAGYPKLFVNDFDLYTMTEADPTDATYSDGKIYTYSVSNLPYTSVYSYIFMAESSYSYLFMAADINGAPAEGEASLVLINGPTIINHSPILAWAGTPNYENIGIFPSTGTPLTTFIFCVSYLDDDNNPPKTGYPKVHILKGGIEITNSPFTMNEIDANDTTYNNGKLYNYSAASLLSGTNYTYYFEGYDNNNVAATGIPLTARTGPDISALLADLIITDISNSWTDPISVGDDLSLSLTCKNQGEINITQAYKITFYLSLNKDLNNSIVLHTYASSIITNPLIAAGSSSNAALNIFLPATIPAGMYYIGIKIDSDNEIVELSEINNVYWSTHTKEVISGNVDNDLKKAFCYPSPANLAKGDMIGFAQFTPHAQVKILSSAGYILKELTADSNGYIAPWDGRTDTGDRLASGLYIVHARGENDQVRMFKILIIN